MSRPAEDTPDVLPPFANRTLATLWILLLGGRWLATPWLMTNEHTADWDQHIFLPCYGLLLMITLTVLALRTVRRGRNLEPPDEMPEPDQPTHAEASETPGADTEPPDFRQEPRIP